MIELGGINPGKCKIPNIYRTEQISEIINKFENRKNCGPGKNESCSDKTISLRDFIIGGRDQTANESTHWHGKELNAGGNASVDCDDVCFCYPEHEMGNCKSDPGCENNGTCCPYKCSCSDAINNYKCKEKKLFETHIQ